MKARTINQKALALKKFYYARANVPSRANISARLVRFLFNRYQSILTVVNCCWIAAHEKKGKKYLT